MRRIATLALAALFAACQAEAPPPADHDHEDEEHGGHAAHDAQFGGTLVELGQHEANIEVLLDSGAGSLTILLWDAHVTGPARSDMAAIEVKCDIGELELKPVANELTGETVGDTARFAVKSDKLKGLKSLKGTVKELRLMGLEFRDTEFEAEALESEHG